jgi:hypothetical protein
MIGNSSTSPAVASNDDPFRRPYLTTSRALVACTRELARLSQAIVQEVASVSAGGGEVTAALRQSPDRLIVQFGPVALTVAWLRSTPDSVASGELLVIVWRGVVAPRFTQEPSRMAFGSVPLRATSLWEGVFAATAENEEEWMWHPLDDETERSSSAQLARTCVERLQDAFMRARSAA